MTLLTSSWFALRARLDPSTAKFTRQIKPFVKLVVIIYCCEAGDSLAGLIILACDMIVHKKKATRAFQSKMTFILDQGKTTTGKCKVNVKSP